MIKLNENGVFLKSVKNYFHPYPREQLTPYCSVRIPGEKLAAGVGLALGCTSQVTGEGSP